MTKSKTNLSTDTDPAAEAETPGDDAQRATQETMSGSTDAEKTDAAGDDDSSNTSDTSEVETRTQHYIDPKTGEKTPVRVKILRGGKKRDVSKREDN